MVGIPNGSTNIDSEGVTNVGGNKQTIKNGSSAGRGGHEINNVKMLTDVSSIKTINITTNNYTTISMSVEKAVNSQ